MVSSYGLVRPATRRPAALRTYVPASLAATPRVPMPVRLAPLAAQARRRRIAQVLATGAVALYITALQKFVVRPPLGGDVGFQGMFELTAVALSCLLACAAALA